MSSSQGWNFVTSPDLMALFSAISLIAGGAALITSSIPMRAERLARRISLALPRKNLVSPKAPEAHLSIIQQIPSIAAGLSEVEQRLIILRFSKLGVPANLALPYFFVFRGAIALGLGALIFAGSGQFGIFAASWLLRIVAATGAAIVGWLLPSLFLAFEVKQRAKSVATALPEALELLVVCVEAGLSLEDGLHRVAEEIAVSQPALADELALTWAEMNILPNRSQALINLSDRVNDPGVRAVVSMLSQSLRLGTPLAQSLRVGAVEMRNDQITNLEERASRLPALLTVPVMLFMMPTIFLIIGGPAALRIFDIFKMSH